MTHNIPKIIPTEDQDFARDTVSGAVININREKFKNYKLQRQYEKSVKVDVDELKDRMDSIESMLKELLKRNG